MSDLTEKFKKAAKYAAAGAGTAVVAAAVLPVITVSAPVVLLGAAVGGYLGFKND